ncbi:MAG: putative peptidoglycan glycosyltransferase FtsW [bacterium]|nr:putative peptidoglycan glycosyltransferase FtsW [bacterium]
MTYSQSLARDNTIQSTRLLALITFTLVFIGLIMIYSASAIVAWKDYDQLLFRGDSSFYLRHQFYWLLGGIAAFILASMVPYREFQRWSFIWLGIGIIILILTKFSPWGVEINNSQRWLAIPWTGFAFQPAEMVKLILIVFVADFISRKQNVIKEFKRGLLPLLIAIGTVMFLVLIQPHLGMTILLGLVTLLLLIIGGVRVKYLFGFIAAGLLIGALVIRDYQLERFLAVLSPDLSRKAVVLLYSPEEVEEAMKSVEKKRYHLNQFLLALGSGGVLGRGPGESQQKMFFLPAPHTDSVFAILGEEHGFLGTGIVLSLFLLLFWTGIKIALNSKDMFGSLLAFGLTALIVIQAGINMAVTTGSLPTTGLPLPFISYGGSSLFFTLIGVGMLLNIGKTVDRI